MGPSQLSGCGRLEDEAPCRLADYEIYILLALAYSSNKRIIPAVPDFNLHGLCQRTVIWMGR